MSKARDERSHVKSLLVNWKGLGLLATTARLFTTLTLLMLPRFVPAFDESAATILSKNDLYLQGFLRWDTLYFERIAASGYTREQEYAFMPGLPYLMRYGGQIYAGMLGYAQSTPAHRLIASVFLANTASVLSTLVLYRLSFTLLRDETLAFVTGLIHCFPPSPAIYSIPYNEPFFALLSFSGMWAFENQLHLLASVFFAATTYFRANGVLYCGLFIWHYIFEKYPIRRPNQILLPTLYSLITVSPFVLVQYMAYQEFCLNSRDTRPWCESQLPLIYPFVQAHYWDVGFLRYWTFKQSPLFLISAPLLSLSFYASYVYYSSSGNQWLQRTFPFFQNRKTRRASFAIGFHTNPKLLPYIHLHTLLTCILLFNSHVQICLRLFVTDPVVFWFLAVLMQQQSKYAEWWRRYVIIWAPISVILWAGFYPPA